MTETVSFTFAAVISLTAAKACLYRNLSDGFDITIPVVLEYLSLRTMAVRCCI